MNSATKKKLLFIIILFIFLGIFASTQYFAHILSYQEALGNGLEVGKIKIYMPLQIIFWYIDFYDEAPQVFESAFKAFYVCSIFGIILMLYARRKLVKPVLTSHGSARWANLEEVKETGLLNKKGIFLGKFYIDKNSLFSSKKIGKYLRDNNVHHSIVISPTRGGKGSGLVLPTALTWQHSMVVTDIKGEVWANTAEHRRKKLNNVCIRFEPTDNSGFSAKYNPLDDIRIKTDKEIQDTQNLVSVIIDPEGKGENDHFTVSAGNLISCMILWLKYTRNNPSLTDVLSVMFPEEGNIVDTLNEITKTDYSEIPLKEGQKEISEIYLDSNDSSHPQIIQLANSMLAKPEKEFGSVLSTADKLLSLYRDPVLIKNISESNFLVDDLANFEKPVSLYLVVPPSDIKRMTPIFRILVEQIYRRAIEKKLEFENGQAKQYNKHRMLLLLDEFPALGRLDTFEAALAYIAGYGIKAMLIAQSINQINKLYTRDNSIIDNCHIRTFHTPNDLDTAKYMSGMLGKTTILLKNKTYSNNLGQIFGENTYTMSEGSRDLMTPDEVSKMDPEKEIIFVAGYPPIFCNKIRHYKDENFMSRIQDNSENGYTRIKGEKVGFSVEYEKNTVIKNKASSLVEEQELEKLFDDLEHDIEKNVYKKDDKDLGVEIYD